jgi:hypothetical protein
MHRPLSHDITGWIRVPMPLISPTYLLNEAPMMTCDISFPIVPAVKDYDPNSKYIPPWKLTNAISIQNQILH